MDCSTPDLAVPISQSLLKFMCIESVMPSNHLILCRPLPFLPSIFKAEWKAEQSQGFKTTTSGFKSEYKKRQEPESKEQNEDDCLGVPSELDKSKGTQNIVNISYLNRAYFYGQMPTCLGGPRYASMDLPDSSHPYLPLHAKYKHRGLMVLILCETGNGPHQIFGYPCS